MPVNDTDNMPRSTYDAVQQMLAYVPDGREDDPDFVSSWCAKVAFAIRCEEHAAGNLNVLSIGPEDLDEQLSPEARRAIAENSLDLAVLERARKYMWNSMDCSDTFSRDICEAADAVLREQHIDIDYGEADYDIWDGEIPF